MTDSTVDKAALAAKGLRVKPLEWERSLANDGTPKWTADRYAVYVFTHDGPQHYRINNDLVRHPTLEAAKAAAQADYEARILAALTAHEAKEADNG